MGPAASTDAGWNEMLNVAWGTKQLAQSAQLLAKDWPVRVCDIAQVAGQIVADVVKAGNGDCLSKRMLVHRCQRQASSP
eukprot:2862860-Alexandrium_andersonii.AAC.1